MRLFVLAATLMSLAPNGHSLALVSHYLSSLYSAGEFSGNVVIAQRGKIIFQRSYGYANVEFRVPNSPATRFRIFSTTKPIIATAVLQLASKGRLSLDAPVGPLLPELPPAWKRVTVRELLQHTSGVPDDEQDWASAFEQGNAQTQIQNLKAISATIKNQQLLSVPGAAWRYNNFGYDLLGCIIERASHRSLSQYLSEYIFGPAGMQGAVLQGRANVPHTMYSGNAEVVRLASGYNGGPHSLETADPQMYASAGAGGVIATTSDLLHFDSALSRGTLVPKSWEAQAVSKAIRVNNRAGYGYGWIVVHTVGGTSYLHHSGGSNGFTSDYVRVPTIGLCVVILSNYGFAPAEDTMRNSILTMLLGTSYRLPKHT